MKKPLVSIIIPAYNSEKYIHHLFESLLIQTNKDFEVIVINDGSTDKTEDVLKKYKQTFLSLNIQFEYINKANAGLGSAINDGLKKVRGEYFCWADSDDFYVNNFFEKMLNFFKKHPNCMFVRGDAYILPNAKINDYNLNELKRKSDYNIDIYKKNLFLNIIVEKNFHLSAGCIMVRTEAFDKVVKNRNIFPGNRGQNWQIILPLSYEYPAYYLNEPLYFIVKRDDSMENFVPEKRALDYMYTKMDGMKKILENTILQMNIKEEKYYLELIRQKYVCKKLELAEKYNNKEAIEKYKKQYLEFKNNNYYEKAIDEIHNDLPMVSIIIPVEKNFDKLKETIDNALDQTYSNFEVIVVSNQKKPQIENLIKTYDKIKYYHVRGKIGNAINYGIMQMNGSIFSYLSQHDRYYPTKLEEMIRYYCNSNLVNKKVVLYTNYSVVDKNDQLLFTKKYEDIYSNDELSHLPIKKIHISTMLIPKQAFEDSDWINSKHKHDKLELFNFIKEYTNVFIPYITIKTTNHT